MAPGKVACQERNRGQDGGGQNKRRRVRWRDFKQESLPVDDPREGQRAEHAETEPQRTSADHDATLVSDQLGSIPLAGRCSSAAAPHYSIYA